LLGLHFFGRWSGYVPLPLPLHLGNGEAYPVSLIAHVQRSIKGYPCFFVDSSLFFFVGYVSVYTRYEYSRSTSSGDFLSGCGTFTPLFFFLFFITYFRDFSHPDPLRWFFSFFCICRVFSFFFFGLLLGLKRGFTLLLNLCGMEFSCLVHFAYSCAFSAFGPGLFPCSILFSRHSRGSFFLSFTSSYYSFRPQMPEVCPLLEIDLLHSQLLKDQLPLVCDWCFFILP